MTVSNMYLEHANITVSNLDQSVKFFTIAFPDFKVRGTGMSNKKWLHLGNEQTYIALNEAVNINECSNNYGTTGINHLGFVVKDVSAIAIRLSEAGYQRTYPAQHQKFRIREYFADHDGNEYEFVEYLSEVDAERNSYED